MSLQDILAAQGIISGVGPTDQSFSKDLDSVDGTTCLSTFSYPVATVSTLSIAAFVPWVMLLITIVKFKRVIWMYLSNMFEYSMSNRTDLECRLTYEFRVGGELTSATYMSSHDTMILEETTEPTPVLGVESELSEVITQRD